MIRASILIASADPSGPGFARCMAELRAHTRDVEVLVLNNPREDFSITNVMNRLVRASVGRYIVIMGDDCFVAEGWLDKMVTEAMSDPRIGIVGGLPHADKLPYFVSFAFVLVKREVFEKIGPYDERLVFAFDDNDICDRAIAAGFALSDVETGASHQDGGSGSPMSVRVRRARTATIYFRKRGRFWPILYWVPKMLFLPYRKMELGGFTPAVRRLEGLHHASNPSSS